MTDRDEWREWFERWGILFTEYPGHDESVETWDNPAQPTIQVIADTGGPHVEGYSFFHVDVTFSKDGTFQQFGIWE